MSAEEDLQKIANGQWWNLPATGKTVEALRNLQTILGNVASDTGITGMAGMSASETLDQTKKDIELLITYVERTLPDAVKAANDARDTAKAELSSLGAGQLDAGQLTAIRGAEVGATVLLGPFSIIAGEGAIAIANSILGNQRDSQAEASLDKVNAQLQAAHEQISAPPRVSTADNMKGPGPVQDPEPAPWVDRGSQSRSGDGGSPWAGGGGGYVPGPGGGAGYSGGSGYSGGPGYTVLPNPGGSGGPVIVPTPDGPISGGTGFPGGNGGGGIHVPGGGAGNGLLGGGSGGITSGLIAGGGGAAALGGLGKLATGGGAGSLGRLGGGGLGSGSSAGLGASGAGTTGRSGGLLGGSSGSSGAAGAGAESTTGRGSAGMAGGGMGGQGGAGGKNDKRGRGLGGPLAPKLEDDEEIGPWSENAGAGGRD